MISLVTAIFFVACGTWMIRRGWWPRRLGQTPHCLKCGYILAGIQAERCPECGRELSPGNVVQGERRRSPALVSFGIVLMLIALFLGAADITGALQQVDWYQYRPTAWLMTDLNAVTSATRDRAWTELQRRLLIGSLSTDQQSRLVQRALLEQQTGGGASGYMAAMTDFLGQRYLDHKLSTAEANAFFANAMKLQLDVRPIVGRGDPIPFRISTVGHGPQNGWWMRQSERGYWVDDRKFDRGTSSSTGGFNGRSSLSSLESQPPGKHRLRVEVEVGTGLGNFGSVSGPLDRARTVELTADFQVLSDQLPMQWTASPGAATIRKCLNASDFLISAGQYQPLSGSIEAVNPPVNLAFDVFARMNGNEYSLGQVVFHQASGPNSSAFYQLGAQSLPPGDFRTIDIILRSSEKAAKNTIDFTTAWQGEIVIPNVQVRQGAASQPVPAAQK